MESNRRAHVATWTFGLFLALVMFLPSAVLAQTPGLVGHWTFEPGAELRDLTGNFGDLQLTGGATIANGALDLNAGSAALSGPYVGPTLTSKTLVAWLRMDSLDVQAGSPLALENQSTLQFDAIVYGERQTHRWMAGSDNFLRTLDPNPGFAEASTGQMVMVAISYEDQGNGTVRVRLYRNGIIFGDYISANFVAWNPGTVAMFGPRLRLSDGTLYGDLDAHIEEAQIYDDALSASEIAALAPPAHGLVGYWSFDDGTATDRSGFGNHGTIVGGAVATAGVVGQALDLSAAGDYVTIPNSASLQSANLTVAYWAKLNFVHNPVIATKRNLACPDCGGAWQVSVTSTDNAAQNLQGAVWPTGGDYSAAINPSPVGRWTHVVVTYDGAYVDGYLDGVRQFHTAYVGGHPELSQDAIRLGSVAWGGGPISNEYYGLIDELRIYDTALTSSEVAALYQGGWTNACDAGSYLAEPGGACTPASPGTFVATAGATSATVCVPGTFQPNIGETSCLLSPLGRFVDQMGAIAATACPLGKYADTLGSVACTNAPAGTYVNIVGAASATPCAPGSYSAIEGAASCTPASAGFYVPLAGAAAQLMCPVGSTSTAGAVACTAPLALPAGATYSASSSYPGAGPANAFDGNATTLWNAGGHTGWIEVDFGSPQTLTGITALVSQSPAGNTVHTVTLDGQVAFTWSGPTSDGQQLTHAFATPQTVRRVRVTTNSSPSWVAWWEIAFQTAVVAPPPTSYASAVLADSPLAFFRLGDAGSSVVDSSGHGHTGQASGAVTFGGTGALIGDADTAVTMAGGLIRTTAAQQGVSRYTIEAWVNTTAAAEAIVTDRRGHGYGDRGLGLWVGGSSPGDLTFALNGDNIWIGVSSTQPVNDGQWHHVVGVFDGSGTVTPGQFTIYVDGVAQTSPVSFSNATTSAPLTGDPNGTVIGSAMQTWPSAAWSSAGAYDEVALYDFALSADRVLAHYQAAAGAQGPTIERLAAFDFENVTAENTQWVVGPLSAPASVLHPSFTSGAFGWTDADGYFFNFWEQGVRTWSTNVFIMRGLGPVGAPGLTQFYVDLDASAPWSFTGFSIRILNNDYANLPVDVIAVQNGVSTTLGTIVSNCTTYPVCDRSFDVSATPHAFAAGLVRLVMAPQFNTGSAFVMVDDITIDGIAAGTGTGITCDAGTYLASPTAAFCTPAEPGKFVATDGATEATTCAAGYYQPDAGQTSCLASPVGRYVAGTGAIEAALCAAGTYQPDAGQTACLASPAGKYVAGTGAIEATPCAVGYFSATTGAAACSVAPAGSFVDAAGAAGATLCAPGSFQPLTGQSSCTLAPAGSYVATSGATSPTTCPTGMMSEAGASICADVTPPVLSGMPAGITEPMTTVAGAVVTWAAPTAQDVVDGSVAVTCAPASGSTIAVGTTTVTCSAVDLAHNTATATFAVTVTPVPPVLTALSNHYGRLAGGTPVTITGTNLGGATAVMFGTGAATIVSVTETSIDVLSPASPLPCVSPCVGYSAGVTDVTVTTPYGTSAVNPADRFVYGLAPSVTSISPASGSTNGRTYVTITGRGLLGATSVMFGSTPALSVRQISQTQLGALSPPGAAGAVDITVTTRYGTSAVSLADQFTYYESPIVTGVSPNLGTYLGGTVVTITGANLEGATAVNFQYGATARQATIVSNTPTSITVRSPRATITMADVRVVTRGGTSAITVADRFTYGAPPQVGLVVPNVGLSTGGTTVTIRGRSFTGATAVAFGGVSTNFQVVSDGIITATSPAGLGAVPIEVTNPFGPGARANAFVYNGPPVLTRLSRTDAPMAGGVPVTIYGTDLATTTAVSFGGLAAKIAARTATSVTVTSPAAAPGAVGVTVTNVYGTTTGLEMTFMRPAPAIYSLKPASAQAGDSNVTFTASGANFVDGATVTVTLPGGVTQTTAAQVSSASALGATFSIILPAGTVQVSVANPAPSYGPSVNWPVFVTESGAAVTAKRLSTSGFAALGGTIGAAGGGGTGLISVAKYSGDPSGGAPGLLNVSGTFLDLYVAPGSTFTRVTVVLCDSNPKARPMFYDARSARWLPLYPARYTRPLVSSTGCPGGGFVFTASRSSRPSLSQLSGTYIYTDSTNPQGDIQSVRDQLDDMTVPVPPGTDDEHADGRDKDKRDDSSDDTRSEKEARHDNGNHDRSAWSKDLSHTLGEALKDDRWADQSHLDRKSGEKVYEAIEQAIVQLLAVQARPDLLEADGIPADVIGDWISQLAGAAQLLSQTAIDDAVAGGGRAQQVTQANGEMASGATALEALSYEGAVEHFEQAWSLLNASPRRREERETPTRR